MYIKKKKKSTLRYIPIWSWVHSYHTFCTHIYNPNVHFTSKINIFTQKRKTTWINNFIDEKNNHSRKLKIVRETWRSRLHTVSLGAAACSAHTALNSVTCWSFTHWMRSNVDGEMISVVKTCCDITPATPEDESDWFPDNTIICPGSWTFC